MYIQLQTNIERHCQSQDQISAGNPNRFDVAAQAECDEPNASEIPATLTGKLPGRRAVCVRRIHFLDDQPVCYEVRFLRKDWCASILQEDLESTSIHALIAYKLALPITRVWQRLEAVNLSKTVAEGLQTTIEVPAFCMRQLIYSRAEPISYVDYFLRSDVYAFEDSFEPGKPFSRAWTGNGGFTRKK